MTQTFDTVFEHSGSNDVKLRVLYQINGRISMVRGQCGAVRKCKGPKNYDIFKTGLWEIPEII